MIELLEEAHRVNLEAVTADVEAGIAVVEAAPQGQGSQKFGSWTREIFKRS